MTLTVKSAIVGTLGLLLAMTYLYLINIPSPQPLPRPALNDSQRDWIKERHRYHGINVSIAGPGGEFYFIRNGIRCRL